ncbi:indolepyruvate oxidoreductase subunit beta [bacterium]|nr:indolepyruvate oxidoreductase subunit beta [bacterium]
MPQKTTNIFVAGVGGQGILKFSELLCETAMRSGLDVKKSEIHGMAQRGGSVTTHLRFGEKVYSPLIPEAKADFIVAMEHLEALRHISFLNPDSGRLIYDTYEIAPPEVYTALKPYPDDLEIRLEKFAKKRIQVPAFEIAREMGNVRAQNVVMLGSLSVFVPFEESLFIDVIRSGFPAKFAESNLKAFERGRELASH